MFNKFKTLMKEDELVKGSLVLFVMINIFNVLNYIFQFSMARLLGPADYGILAVLFSFIYIFAVPSEAIQNIITSYASRFHSKKELGKIKFMLSTGLRKSMIMAAILFVIFLPIALFFAIYLQIDYLLFVITGVLIFFFFSLPVARGVLQGQKKFVSLGWSMIIEGIFKVGIGIFLVIVGWSVYGSIFAVILAVAASFFIIFLFIKDILKSDLKKEDFKGIYSYSVPYFISILAIVLIYSLDVIFVKRFFDADIAGKYSVVSMLGRIIFFGTFAVSKAMFPLTSENHNEGSSTKDIFRRSIKILLLLSAIILLLYLFFPTFIISILFGKQYVEVANILFIVGLSLTFLSLSNLFVLYGLSINRIKKASWVFLGFVLIEIVLFSFFHESLMQFSLSFLVVNILMFIYSLFVIKK